MRFTDGYWQLRPGVTAHYPAEAYEIRTSEATLTVEAPTRPIEHRGDTLNTPMLTVELSSPLADVVRVRITRYAGRLDPGPHFEVTDHDPPVELHLDDEVASLTSGRLSARVSRGRPFGLEFVADGRRLTGSGTKAMAAIELPDGAHHLREQLALGVDTHVYGLGERFGPFVKNGQSVDIWNADGGTATEQAYKNVPFYLTDSGYGVFVDHPGRVSFEVASEVNSRVSFSVEDHELSYLVIHGPSPKEILERYTALTGRPAVPPPWSYGLWLSTSFTTDYDEATVTSFIDGMEQRDLPLSVFHFDCFWMREFHWTDLEWDPRTFPDPEGMLQRLHERGLRVCVWINPYIAQRSALFDEGKEHGYLVKRADGSVWQWDQWQAGMGLVDVTNPEARAWFAGKLEQLVDMGVDSFKTDFGERIPTDVVWYDGSDPQRMHNHYSYQYNQTVFEVLERRRGAGDAVVFARSATVGGQRYPVHWGGDSESTFTSMAESLRGGLSLGLSGFGFWSHDIGGFEGTPDPEVFKRWIAFGLLSSHSRLHGSGSYRVPWAFDDEAVEVLRHFTHLKHRLMPYLWQASQEAAATGVPLMRAMVVEFPDDPACSYLDRQYLLGPDLLVAPVFRADGRVSYYVPSGDWTHLLTGEVVTGPGWVDETHATTSLPLLARPGSVIALGARVDGPDYDHADGVTLQVHALEPGGERTVRVGGPDGPVSTFQVRRDDETITATLDGPSAPWSLQLTGGLTVGEVTGGALGRSDLGPRVDVPTGTSQATLTILPEAP